MIVLDFKENIRLGDGPVETGQNYFTRQQCSVLGVAVVYWNQVKKQPSVEYVDYFSDILSHDALFVSNCVGNVLDNFIKYKYRNLNIKKVHFWNDTGRHFQCGEFAHYLLKILEKNGLIFHIESAFRCHSRSALFLRLNFGIYI